MGLSQVYGFVKQSGGHIKIYSEVGQGTAVKIYLLRFLGEKDQPGEDDDRELEAAGVGECILVVEDDHDVRAPISSICCVS